MPSCLLSRIHGGQLWDFRTQEYFLWVARQQGGRFPSPRLSSGTGAIEQAGNGPFPDKAMHALKMASALRRG